MTSSASNKSALWACNPESCLEPRLSSSGQGSIEAKTVIQVFRETVAKYPNEPALQLKRRVNVRQLVGVAIINPHGIKQLFLPIICRVNFLTTGKFGPGLNILMTALVLPRL